MDVRLLLTATVLVVLAGCGGEESSRELHLLAPAGYVEDGSTDPSADWVTPFERATGCRVDVRVYDEGEDVGAIARRRDADVIAGPFAPRAVPHASADLVRITLDGGVTITIPRSLAPAFRGTSRPAGRRTTGWVMRREGDNRDCARRWIAYVTSPSVKARSAAYAGEEPASSP
jgi:spermidine/putrescine-binding protein